MVKKRCKCKCTKSSRIYKRDFPGLPIETKERLRKQGYSEDAIRNMDKYRKDAQAYEEMVRQMQR